MPQALSVEELKAVLLLWNFFSLSLSLYILPLHLLIPKCQLVSNLSLFCFTIEFSSKKQSYYLQSYYHSSLHFFAVKVLVKCSFPRYEHMCDISWSLNAVYSRKYNYFEDNVHRAWHSILFGTGSRNQPTGLRTTTPCDASVKYLIKSTNPRRKGHDKIIAGGNFCFYMYSMISDKHSNQLLFQH